jgi:hypothetical protein
VNRAEGAPGFCLNGAKASVRGAKPFPAYVIRGECVFNGMSPYLTAPNVIILDAK